MDREFMWAVGLFEGEGTIVVSHNGQRASVIYVKVVMADEEVVRRFHRAVGVGNVTGPSQWKSSPKPLWSWRVSKRSDAVTLIGRMMPHLGSRRQEQAHIALRFNNDHPVRVQSVIITDTSV